MNADDRLRIGDIAAYGGLRVAPDDIAAFGESIGFDARSNAAARWLGVSLQLRMIVDGLYRHRPSQGAPGLESVEWHSLVQPGDTLRVRHEILEARASRSRPDIDLIRVRFDTFAQQDRRVQTVHQWVMFKRSKEPAAAVPTTAAPPDEAASHPARYTPPSDRQPLMRTKDAWKGWERAIPGMQAQLGACRFDAADLKAFARAFDPQPFHLDEEAARRSIFGRLCASGLHSVVVWAALADDARWPVQPGGFRNLKWHRPVFAGDTIQYRSVVKAVARDPQRADLAWVTRLNQGSDAAGGPVIELEDRVAVSI